MFTAVLDANVIYPFTLRDVLLTLAEREFFRPTWSQEILDEATRNLLADDVMGEDQARQLVAQMNIAFDDALVDGRAVNDLVPAMTNDPKDRHVLAAAVVCGADAIITQNLRDFPGDACAPHGVDVLSPDEFLSSMFDMNPSLVADAITWMANQRKNPPLSLRDISSRLSRTGCNQFSGRLEEWCAGSGSGGEAQPS